MEDNCLRCDNRFDCRAVIDCDMWELKSYSCKDFKNTSKDDLKEAYEAIRTGYSSEALIEKAMNYLEELEDGK